MDRDNRRTRGRSADSNFGAVIRQRWNEHLATLPPGGLIDQEVIDSVDDLEYVTGADVFVAEVEDEELRREVQLGARGFGKRAWRQCLPPVVHCGIAALCGGC